MIIVIITVVITIIYYYYLLLLLLLLLLLCLLRVKLVGAGARLDLADHLRITLAAIPFISQAQRRLGAVTL